MYVIYHDTISKLLVRIFFYETNSPQNFNKTFMNSYWSQELDIGNINGKHALVILGLVPNFNIPLNHNMTLLSQKITRY
jgi:hypothetical protein